MREVRKLMQVAAGKSHLSRCPHLDCYATHLPNELIFQFLEAFTHTVATRRALHLCLNGGDPYYADHDISATHGAFSLEEEPCLRRDRPRVG